MVVVIASAFIEASIRLSLEMHRLLDQKLLSAVKFRRRAVTLAMNCTSGSCQEGNHNEIGHSQNFDI